MSATPTVREPGCEASSSAEVELLIEGRPRDLGGFVVRRLLPAPQRRRVGPFVFFDQMGPAQFAAGTGMDVRPHPHIALSTLTFLFEGAIEHRDSLGTLQVIRPGDVNWMVAGHGIVHSERTPAEERANGGPVYGIQTWLALPREHEETAPRFEHHAAASVPHLSLPGVELDVIAGSAFGRTSPVGVFSRTLYVHALLSDGARLVVDAEHEERAVYVVAGKLACAGQSFETGQMFVLKPGSTPTLCADGAVRLMLLGGEPLDGERFMFWNFVASSEERLERAKADWKAGRFAKVPGDELEFIPLPE